MALKDRIREARLDRGMTQKVVADALRIRPAAVSQWETGETVPESSRIAELAKVLGVSASFLLDAIGPMPPPAPPILPLPAGLPKDVPVLGTAQAGSTDEGDFEMNGEQIDMAPRPPSLAGAKTVFAIYCQGMSMSPWREPGQPVYLHPGRQARIGDFVVVELVPKIEGEPPRAYLKRLVGRTASKLKLEQFNPKRDLEIPAAQVKAVHRVVDWPELLGF